MRESVERVYCLLESVIKFFVDLQCDLDFFVSVVIVEYDVGDVFKFKESMSLNMVENVVGVEDMNFVVGLIVFGYIGDCFIIVDEVEIIDL